MHQGYHGFPFKHASCCYTPTEKSDSCTIHFFLHPSFWTFFSLHVKINLIRVMSNDPIFTQTQVILVDGVLMVYTEEMERAPSGASGVLSRQTSEKWEALSRMAFAHFGRQIYILLIGKSFVLLGIAQISPFNAQWNFPAVWSTTYTHTWCCWWWCWWFSWWRRW